MYGNISPEMLRGIGTHLKTSTFIGSAPNMSNVGKPPKSPGVPAPTVGTKGIPAIKTPEAGSVKPPSGESPSGGSQGLSDTTKQAFLETGLGPLFAGAAGGGLGYMTGSHLINPILAGREAAVHNRMQQGEQMLKQLRSAKKATPWVAGAVGALLLASIAAKKAREDEREKIETRKFWMAPENQALVNEIQGAQAGFIPGQQATINQQYPFY